jgi:CRISPR-associated protein Csm5
MTRNKRHSGVLRITPAAPIHIGSGEKITPMDYDLKNGEFRVKDVLGYFESQRDDPGAAMAAVRDGLPLGEEFIRYRMPSHGEGPGGSGGGKGGGPGGGRGGGKGGGRRGGGKGGGGKGPKMDPQMKKLMDQAEKKFGKTQPPPDSRQEKGAEINEFIKDPFGHPYLPGSSLKGCLRTAIAYALSEHCPPGPKVIDRLKRGRQSRQWIFSQAVNGAMFSDGPKNSATSDVLKALVVRDSKPFEDIAAAFAMTHIRVMNVMHGGFRPKQGMPIYAESLMPEAGAFDVPFYIDLFPLEETVDRHLQKAAGGHAAKLLRDRAAFEKALLDFSRALAAYELDFYREQGGGSAEAFLKDAAKDGAILLNLGFGTGWHSKTVGMQLKDHELDAIRKEFRLSRHPDALFPKTRKWAATGKGQEYRPMGWFRLEVIWQ